MFEIQGLINAVMQTVTTDCMRVNNNCMQLVY